MSTNYGFRIYETKTYKQVSSSDDINKYGVGDIYNCTTLYNSQIVVFMFNNKEKRNGVFFFDDGRKTKIGCVVMTEEIEKFFVSHKIFALFPKNKSKVLLFEMKTLKYITTVNDVYKHSLNHAENLKTERNKITLAHISSLNKNYMKIIVYLTNDKSGTISKKMTMSINTNFNAIQTLELLSDFIIVSSSCGNKIHLYSLKDFSLMYCLFLGNFAYELGNFSVDKKNKFLMLSTNNKYIKMFKLKDLKENNEDICSCDDHDDDEVDHNPRKSISFFLQKMLVDTTQMHCRYRYDSKVENLAMFDPESDDKFNIIESNGEVKVVNFNRKKSGSAELEKNIKWNEEMN